MHLAEVHKARPGIEAAYSRENSAICALANTNEYKAINSVAPNAAEPGKKERSPAQAAPCPGRPIGLPADVLHCCTGQAGSLSKLPSSVAEMLSAQGL